MERVCIHKDLIHLKDTLYLFAFYICLLACVLLILSVTFCTKHYQSNLHVSVKSELFAPFLSDRHAVAIPHQTFALPHEKVVNC